MFESTSRYYALENAEYRTGDSRAIAYKRRRFLPEGKNMPLMAEVTVAQGDRLDIIAARALGDPEQFWRVCDANDAMNPSELIKVGKVLRVCTPQF